MPKRLKRSEGINKGLGNKKVHKLQIFSIQKNEL